jgi:putative GTP pyrophosphokinase
MSNSLPAEYEIHHRDILVPIAEQLSQLISNHLAGIARVDRVTARAKSPERFIAKARREGIDGRPRYANPLGEIQDQIAARVIVFYKDDVDTIGRRLIAYFRPIEERTLVPESEWAFGYFGKHYVLALPSEAVPPSIGLAAAPRFFELQIKTLFQHAWAEANHDLGYKPPEDLTDDQKRRLAYTAAQAWGADRIFQELATELQPPMAIGS